jgi:hypothetical protein
MTEQAEMLTDSLRAMLLQACGYDAQVFEFISPEHTGKNKMVLAVRRPQALPASQRTALLAKVAELKAFYGVTEQQLETLLLADAPQAKPHLLECAPRPAEAGRPPWGSSKVAKPHLLESIPGPLVTTTVAHRPASRHHRSMNRRSAK